MSLVGEKHQRRRKEGLGLSVYLIQDIFDFGNK